METVIKIICKKIFEVIKDEKTTREAAHEELRAQISNLSNTIQLLQDQQAAERIERTSNDEQLLYGLETVQNDIKALKITDESVNNIIDELYNETFNTPQELTLKLIETIASPGNKKDGFGSSIAVSDRGIIIGAASKPAANGALKAGSVYGFIREGDSWVQNQEIKNSLQRPYDRFGQSVAIMNDELIIGAPSEDLPTSNAGTVRRFQWNGDSFSAIAYTLTGRAGVDENSDFGASLAFDDKWMIIGAPARDGTGCVNIYPAAENNKQFVNAFFGPANQQGARYGEAVHMTKDALFIGAPGINKLFVIPRDTVGNFNSNAIASIDAPRTDAFDFGAAIVTHNDHIFVSAPKTYVQGNETGTIFVYKRGENAGEATLVKEIPSPRPIHKILFGAALAVHDSKLYVSTIDTSDVTSAPEKVDVFEITGI